MCNDCECENDYQCSIKGNIPLGFCCPKCIHYNGEHTCLKAKMKVEQKVPKKALENIKKHLIIPNE